MPVFLEFNSEESKKTKITFVITRELGKGATSYCFKGHRIDDPSKKKYAIKIYDSQILSAFYSETSLMSSINSEVFLSLFYKGKGVLHKKSNNELKSKPVHFAIIELAENYELFEYIYHLEKGFTEKHAAEIFLKIISGLKILHERGIAHCDIKPENVLIGKDFSIKLIDFGYASGGGERGEGDHMLYEFQSTEIYGSPEARKSDKNHGYDPIKHDLFSLGVFLFVLVLGCFPYTDYRLSERRYFYIVNNDFDSFWSCFPQYNLSYEFKDLITKLINIDPNKRLSIDEILKHSWLKKNLGLNLENNNADINIQDDYKNELKRRKEIIDKIYKEKGIKK